MAKFVLNSDSRGNWGWALRGDDGRYVASNSYIHKTRADAEAEIVAVREQAPGAEIVDLTEVA